MNYLRILLVLIGALVSLASGCWTTGCNLDSWAQTGCSPFGQVEKSKKPCPGGYIYECCDMSEIEDPGNEDGRDNGEEDETSENDVGEITFEQFRQAVTGNGYPAPNKNKYDAFMVSAPGKGSIKTKVEAAMALAQFLHESAGLTAVREIACARTNCVGSYVTPSCDYPGQYYYGRGYIQLSWCYNYKPASIDLFGDDTLVQDPDMVGRVEKVAWDTAFWFWNKFVHNQSGVKDGKFGVTTKAINGGLECGGGGRIDQAKARFMIYGNVRSALGIKGQGIESGCYN